MPTPTLENGYYLSLFVDEATGFRVSWVITRKNEAVDNFEELRDRIVTQVSVEIKVFSSDNDSVFNCKEAKNLLKQNGIEHQISATSEPLDRRPPSLFLRALEKMLLAATSDCVSLLDTRPTRTCGCSGTLLEKSRLSQKKCLRVFRRRGGCGGAS